MDLKEIRREFVDGIRLPQDRTSGRLCGHNNDAFDLNEDEEFHGSSVTVSLTRSTPDPCNYNRLID
jgi:hypothetical protein